MKPETQARVAAAANRLHHLSMRYVGAFAEIAQGKEVAFLPTGTHGVRELRDLIDLLLFCRAEVNGMSNLLVRKGLITEEEFAEVMEEQYDYFTKVKARFLNVGVTDNGIVYDNPLYGKNN